MLLKDWFMPLTEQRKEIYGTGKGLNGSHGRMNKPR